MCTLSNCVVDKLKYVCNCVCLLLVPCMKCFPSRSNIDSKIQSMNMTYFYHVNRKDIFIFIFLNKNKNISYKTDIE